MNDTKTLWQQLACSNEETHNEEMLNPEMWGLECNIGLKKVLEIKQQTAHCEQIYSSCYKHVTVSHTQADQGEASQPPKW